MSDHMMCISSYSVFSAVLVRLSSLWKHFIPIC